MFIKYPRTESVHQLEEKGIFLSELIDNENPLIIEEKMDGTQVGIRFSENGEPCLQSRGQWVGNEPEFSLLKQWLYTHLDELRELLGSRYILFGEWLYFKHSIFYDQLPDYFMEYDLYDTKDGYFLSTARRHELLKNFPFICSVHVMGSQTRFDKEALEEMISNSSFISEQAFEQLNKMSQQFTEASRMMEGLYLKWENSECVLGRYKWTRQSFIDFVCSQRHWSKNLKVVNQILPT
ncbi:RNA ligase family protein [Pleionea sp. CnH1-48]|uniref:RNA ligase family protein n=1 Tax=Pleionea sp. CnH1-48 TaxID=2954494 RepID=UPI0020983CF6|nr:RNA ligase family protein [Pleionea sp. CnH1-48]MCO7224074.1 RNA ligase family protein [Pleionea sp. CnH1-48]